MVSFTAYCVLFTYYTFFRLRDWGPLSVSHSYPLIRHFWASSDYNVVSSTAIAQNNFVQHSHFQVVELFLLTSLIIKAFTTIIHKHIVCPCVGPGLAAREAHAAICPVSRGFCVNTVFVHKTQTCALIDCSPKSGCDLHTRCESCDLHCYTRIAWKFAWWFAQAHTHATRAHL